MEAGTAAGRVTRPTATATGSKVRITAAAMTASVARVVRAPAGATSKDTKTWAADPSLVTSAGITVLP